MTELTKTLPNSGWVSHAECIHTCKCTRLSSRQTSEKS